MPAIYIAKYNRFVDNIMEKMNKVLRKSYDPVRVRLQPVDSKKKGKKNKKKSSGGKSTEEKKSRAAHKRSNDVNPAPEAVSESIEKSPATEYFEGETTLPSLPKVVETKEAQTSAEVQTSSSTESQTTVTKVQSVSSTSTKPVVETTARSISTTATQKAKSKPTPKVEVSKNDEDSSIILLQASPVSVPQVSSTTAKILTSTQPPAVSSAVPVSNQVRATNEDGSKKKTKKHKGKQNKKSKPRAKGTMYGLSTLRRTGDVTVNMMADHTTVKTDFIIGPLILKVEKEFGRGAKKELKSATATTAEMLGKLTLRIPNGGSAKLHSIKVLQPKQVRVDSVDNHDRTREFIWKRSSDIARVVSQKLKSVTKSLLKAD